MQSYQSMSQKSALAVEGIDGVHKMEFSSFDCAGSFIPWKDYDYPALSKGYMLYCENKRPMKEALQDFQPELSLD